MVSYDREPTTVNGPERSNVPSYGDPADRIERTDRFWTVVRVEQVDDGQAFRGGSARRSSSGVPLARGDPHAPQGDVPTMYHANGKIGEQQGTTGTCKPGLSRAK